MIHESQTDVRWKDVTLGKSRFTIGKVGCVTTCISMLSDYFQCFQTPDQIAQKYVQYNMDGMILWSTLTLAHMAFEARVRSRDDQAIIAALKDPNRAVILNVNNNAHWVVAIGKVPFFNDFFVVDSWDGKVKRACATYKNITGFTTFIRK